MNERAYKNILTDPDSAGMSLIVALDKLTDGHCFAWELDTVFQELEHQDCLPDTEACDRIMALLAVKSNPAHLWDYTVFQGVVQALNFDEAITDSVVECSVGEICWALTELEKFGNYYNENFSRDSYNDDPRIYISGCCSSAGYICLPRYLEFCEEEFSRMHSLALRAPQELCDKINDLAEGNILEEVDEDNPIQVQVSKMQECKVYVEKRLEVLNKQLLALGS